MVILLSLSCFAGASDGINILPAGENACPSRIETLSTDIHGDKNLEIIFKPARWPSVKEIFETPRDWSKYGGVSLTVKNTNSDAVLLQTRIDDDLENPLENHSISGNTSIAPNTTETIIIPFNLKDLGMRAGPPFNGKPMWMNYRNTIKWNHIIAWQLFIHDPKAPTRLVISDVRLIPQVKIDGIVDEYGQYTQADWPGKIKNTKDMITRHAEEKRAFLPIPNDWDEYGGYKNGLQLQATGHFRTQKINGRWWFVTPNGHLFYSLGIDTITIWNPTIITGREKMFSQLPTPDDPMVAFLETDSKNRRIYNFYAANLLRTYGKNYFNEWRKIAIERLRSWGFNTIGDWGTPELFKMHKLPYTVPIHIPITDMPSISCADHQIADVYNPRYAERVNATISQKVVDCKGDPWCLGIFVDNEISWYGWNSEGFELPRQVLSMPDSSSAKRAFIDLLKAKYTAIDKLNTAWGTHFASWDELLTKPFTLPGKLNAAQTEDAKMLLKSFVETYYRLVSSAVRTYAPHKLYLGSRLMGYPPVEITQACAEYADVVSFNIYHKQLDPAKWSFTEKLGKPCLVGEFHFGALDRGIFHAGLVPVKDQIERGKAYQNYVRSVMRMPCFVGCHWFQYVDEPLVGRPDGENYNIGFVSITDMPYHELIKAASDLNRKIYSDLKTRR